MYIRIRRTSGRKNGGVVIRKIKCLVLTVMVALCVAACGGNDGDKTGDSWKGKDNAGTENVDDVAESGDVGEAQNKEGKEEEQKRAPIPSEEYVLYKESYTDSKNYSIYEYDEKGHEVKKTVYYSDGKTKVRTYEYTYNDDGSFKRIPDGSTYKYEEFDAKGRLVSCFDGDVTKTYAYDDKDNIIEEKHVTVRDVVRSWTKKTYRENGICEKVQYYYDDGTPARWDEYTYDEQTGWIQLVTYDENGEKRDTYSPYVWEYEYDEYDRVTMETKKNPERGGVFERYTYEYDEAGGMCKKTDTPQETIYEYKPLSQCIVK